MDSVELARADVEVDLLGLRDPLIDSIDFKFVGMDLGLVVLEFGAHLLQLLSTFLQVGLIQAKLLSDIRSALLCKNVL